jgi:hypothetical protein
VKQFKEPFRAEHLNGSFLFGFKRRITMCVVESILTTAIGAAVSGKGKTPDAPPPPPKPPIPATPPKESDSRTRKIKDDTARAAAGEYGIAATNKTGGLGLTGTATTSKKTLLGSNGQ